MLLPSRAVTLIKEAIRIAKAEFGDEITNVFPSTRYKGRPIRPDAVNHAMQDLCSVLEIVDASPHDLRRTTSTILTSERLLIPPLIRSRLLAHAGE